MRVLRNLGVLGLACAMVMACTTIDPYTREEKTSNTTKGAAIGAAAGVAVGVIAGSTALKRKTAVLVGAGVGALVGAAIGNYMDREEAELRAKLEGTGYRNEALYFDIVHAYSGDETEGDDTQDLPVSPDDIYYDLFFHGVW